MAPTRGHVQIEFEQVQREQEVSTCPHLCRCTLLKVQYHISGKVVILEIWKRLEEDKLNS
jgi:hypothetical protein